MNDEILKPRYKVIANYPFSTHSKNTIVYGEVSYSVSVNDESGKVRHEDYPEIFKKLEWWEDREEKDMPEYVKHTDGSNRVIKVFAYVNGRIIYEKGGGTLLNYLLPASKEEYDNQQSKQLKTDGINSQKLS